MKNVLDSMLALQQLQLTPFKTISPSTAAELETLRTKIPETFLRTFDRFLGRKLKAVSTVRHGVCGECHIQVAVGTLGALAFGQGLQQCGNCGRYLYLPEDEPVFGADSSIKTKPGRTKKTRAAELK